MISRYFLKSFLTLYVAILLVSILVIVIVETMLNLDDVLAMREGAMGVATYLFLRVPAFYLPYLVPVSSFAAAFFALGLAARSHEVVAVKAGGISVQRIALPLLVASALLSGVMLVLDETLVRDASRELDRLTQQAETDVFQSRGLFWYHRGDFFYNVHSADRATRTLQGVRIFEVDPKGRLLRSYMAERVQIGDDQRWHLVNAAVRTFDQSDPAAAPKTVVQRDMVLEVDASDLALLGADPSELSLWRLREYIDASAEEGSDVTRYRAMFNARLAEPLSVTLFALLAVPLGLTVERTRSLAVAGLQGIGLLGAYYGAQTTASLFAGSGVAAASAGPWVVLGAFTAFGGWRFARVPR
jgi:lipopolysaccharide export system permease protein